MSALQQLAAEVEDVFGVSCQLQCDSPVLIDDVSLATHLYHISQEAREQRRQTRQSEEN